MILALFDCDGTLVDSAETIHATMVRTFRAFGRPEPTLSATKAIMGLTLDIAIARIEGKEVVDAQTQAMTAHYKSLFTEVRAAPDFREPLFEGIRPVLDRLEAVETLAMGAVTGKSRRGLRYICEAHGLDRHFIVSRTADDCPSKPHPAMVTECCAEAGYRPDQAVVIGDAIYDMQMAKAAGSRAIGVAWGSASVAALWAAGADAIADRPADLIDLILAR